MDLPEKNAAVSKEKAESVSPNQTAPAKSDLAPIDADPDPAESEEAKLPDPAPAAEVEAKPPLATASIKKPMVRTSGNINISLADDPPKSSKTTVLIIILILILMAVGGGLIAFRNKTFLKSVTSSPTPTPTVAPTPTPTPNPLNKADWSLEVLNGSGEAGLAKKIASELQDLGYPVVKVGNASKEYTKTEIFSKKDLMDKVELVITDVKDVIRIATVSGELKDSTASARIIIGKDSI